MHPRHSIPTLVRRPAPQDVHVHARQPPDHLARGVARHPARPAPMSKNHLRRQRLVDVVDQRRSHRPPVQVHELATELMGQRGVAAHPALLLVGHRPRPHRSNGELRVLDGRVRVGSSDARLEARLGRDTQHDPTPYLPRHRDAALAHEPHELPVGVLGDDAKGGLAHGLQHAQAQVALQGDSELGRGQHALLAQPRKQVGGRDVDKLELVDRLERAVVDHRPRRLVPQHRDKGGRRALEREHVQRGEHGDPRCQQVGDGLQPWAPVRLHLREVVDAYHLGVARQHGTHVQAHLSGPLTAGAEDLQVAQLMQRISVHAIRGHDDVGPAAASAAGFVEHRCRRANSPRVPEVDTKEDPAPRFRRDPLQQLERIRSPYFLRTHFCSLATTWTSESGSWSMILSTMVGRKLFSSEGVSISPTITCSAAESRAAWITAAATSEPPRTVNEAPSCAASVRNGAVSMGCFVPSCTITTMQEPPSRRARRDPRRIKSSEAALPDTATSTSSGDASTWRDRAIESATRRSPICRIADRFCGRKKFARAVSTFSLAYTLPCRIRLRRASGVMSMNWISSARSSSRSGTVSRTTMPVTCSTRSFTLSTCWMFTVVMTSMPAALSSSTSCQRLALRMPVTFVCASSSTSTISGCRCTAASRFISSTTVPLYGTLIRGTTSRPARSSTVRGRL